MESSEEQDKKKEVPGTLVVTVKEEPENVEANDDEETTPSTTGCGSSSEETQTSSDTSGAVQSSSLPPSSSRLMRNLAEKMRRDKLNMYISELSSLVPIVAMATKRMDKTSVLRLSANFLRIHLSLKQSKKKPKLAPDGLEANLSTALLEAIEGFMLIVTSLGKIVYISDSVEKLLGHSQLDLMGQSLYTVCHNGDHELLRHHLQPSSPFDSKERDATESPDYVPRSPSFFGGRPEESLSGLASGERRSFYVRLAERSMARGDPARHVTVHLIGYLRPPNNKKDPKNTKGKKECSSTTSSGDEYLLVCVARPFRNKGITELSLMEAVQDEYVTRHLPDGRIIYSDHRIAFVAGYLTEEVMGLSAFNFIHQDDLPWATVANRQMFSSVEGQGYSVYRLRSKTGALIYLRTRGFLEFNKTTQKVETFVCINTLLTSEEGDKELEKERERITPFITFQQVTTTSTNLSSVAGGPAQLTSRVTPALPSTSVQSNIQTMITKTVTTVPIRQRKELSMESIPATTTSPTHPSPPSATAPASSTTVEDTVSDLDALIQNDLDELGTEEIIDTDSKPDLSQMDIISVTRILPSELHMNGDSHKSFITDSLEDFKSIASSVLPLTSTSNLSLSDLDLTQTFMDGNEQSTLQLPVVSTTPATSPLTMGGTGTMVGRLKRSFSEIEDVVSSRTNSAKRQIIPTAFISSSYTPLHHSPHLGTKGWSSETTTTIIFDQHNNNG